MSYSIIMEQTPNPETIKFITTNLFLPSGRAFEFDNTKTSDISPLANALLNFSFVKQVMITENYISITKHSFVSWEDILLEVRDYIYEYLNSGKSIVHEEWMNTDNIDNNKDFTEMKLNETKMSENVEKVAVQHKVAQSEVEQKIIDVLNEYVLPAVSQDGGLITFEAYQEGIVYLKMRGACSGCPSSTYTLKAGIEALLKKMLPDIVKEVKSEGI